MKLGEGVLVGFFIWLGMGIRDGVILGVGGSFVVVDGTDKGVADEQAESMSTRMKMIVTFRIIIYLTNSCMKLRLDHHFFPNSHNFSG